MDFGLRVWGWRVYGLGLGFRFQVVGVGAEGLGLRDKGSTAWNDWRWFSLVWGLGFRVYDL